MWGKTGSGDGGFGRGATCGVDGVLAAYSAAVGRGAREEEMMVRADS